MTYAFSIRLLSYIFSLKYKSVNRIQVTMHAVNPARIRMFDAVVQYMYMDFENGLRLLDNDKSYRVGVLTLH